MPLFLYKFGFESPLQLRNNAEHNWDDEDSQRVLIEAADEATALAWGREISERFVQLLFRDASVSWRKLGHAHWIEPGFESENGLQRVAVGTFPEFKSWLGPYEGDTRM